MNVIIKYTNENGQVQLINGVEGVTAKQIAEANNLPNGTWQEITIEEAQELQKPTTKDLIKLYTNKVQERLDNFARTEGKAYDNMLSACTYASSSNPTFAAEGQYCVEARDNTWATAYQIMNDALTGQRPIPTWEEIEAELPELAWPEITEE